MPPDAPTAPTPAPAAPAPDTTLANDQVVAKGEARSRDLIQKAVKEQKRLDAERAAKELGEEPAAPAAGERERDPKTGHFLPAGAKPKQAPKSKADTTRADAGPGGAHNPAEPGATPGPATKEAPAEEPEKPGPSADSKARRLVKQGKIAEAMKTIGLDPNHLESPKWATWRKENERRESEILQAHQVVTQKDAEVRQLAQQLVRDFEPFIKARAAFEKGDFEEAFQHAFGTDLNSFQRRALQQMTQPGVAKDPVIAELRKEIQALKQEREQERQQLTQAQQEAQLNQRRQAAWNRNVETLSDSGDPRLAELSRSQKFMQLVWAKQGEHYDPSTDTTLPALEAAEEVLEEWGPVFGGASASSDENATVARQNHAATGQGGTPARRAAKAVTSLNPAEAAEAAPKPKLKGKELIDYHVRLARAQELRNNGV